MKQNNLWSKLKPNFLGFFIGFWIGFGTFFGITVLSISTFDRIIISFLVDILSSFVGSFLINRHSEKKYHTLQKADSKNLTNQRGHDNVSVIEDNKRTTQSNYYGPVYNYYTNRDSSATSIPDKS